MKKAGALLVISGPSGSGKGTVVEKIATEDNYCLSISATTRKPRCYENDNTHYFFKTNDEFKEMIENGKLLEWAEFVGNYYGTPRDYVEKKINEGNNVILEIEVQGALQVKKIYSEAVLIFLIPPTIKELRSRLEKRGTEDEKTIDNRIKRAVEELELLPEYDYIVVNDDICSAKKDIMSIVSAEGMKVRRNKNIKGLFKGE